MIKFDPIDISKISFKIGKKLISLEEARMNFLNTEVEAILYGVLKLGKVRNFVNNGDYVVIVETLNSNLEDICYIPVVL